MATLTPPSDSPPPPPPPEAADQCYRCGYALQGIEDDQPCPECGLLAQRSRRPSDELYDTHPRWLRRLSRGVWMLLAAIPVYIGAPVFMSLISESVSNWTFYTPRGFVSYTRYEHLQRLGFDLAAMLLLCGAWLLTSREGYPPADAADRRLRRWLWWAAFPPTLAMGIVHTAIELSAGGFYGWTTWLDLSLYDVAVFVGVVGSIPLPLLLFLRLRNLAKRARSAHLAEHCAIVGVGATAAMVFAAACGYVSNHADDWFGSTYWTSRSQVSIVILAVTSAAAVLFVIWSLYLLVRFAIAFGRASAELKRRWMRHDRSVIIAVE